MVHNKLLWVLSVLVVFTWQLPDSHCQQPAEPVRSSTGNSVPPPPAATSTPIPGCFTLDFLNAGGNHWKSEYVLSGFSSTNTSHACGIDLLTKLQNALPPSSATYSETLAYNNGAYRANDTEKVFAGNFSGYYIPGETNYSEKLMGIMWLLMLQKTLGVCSDKTYPTGNTYSLVDEVLVPAVCTQYQAGGSRGGRVCVKWEPGRWQKQTTPLYVQTPSSNQKLKEPSNLANYQMYDDWFTCMTNYTEAYDSAKRTYPNYEANKQFIKCDSWRATTHDDNVGFGGNGRQGNRHQNTLKGCADGSLVMDKDSCSMIRQSDITKRCGTSNETINFYGYSDTPISLVLDSSYDIHNNISIVEFPLSERVATRFWTWKGSSKAPLLVYDPSHTGRIESAKQLFGPSTFGGVGNQSRLRPVSFSGDAPRYWKHGFEALGSLDADRDGKVAGEELLPLALWFDADQDAVSDAGEVRTLQEVGITELFYTPDSIDDKNRSIEVAHGFTRVVPSSRTNRFGNRVATWRGLLYEWRRKSSERTKIARIAY